MSIRITLPGAHGVVAGIEFTEGVAVLDGALSPNARSFLTLHGASIASRSTIADRARIAVQAEAQAAIPAPGPASSAAEEDD